MQAIVVGTGQLTALPKSRSIVGQAHCNHQATVVSDAVQLVNLPALYACRSTA